MEKIVKLAIAGLIVFSTPIAFAEDKHDLEKMCGEMMKKADKNSDGSISKDEFLSEKEEKFRKFDKDSNGMLSKEEHKSMVMEMHDKFD